ncbi:MAG: hypothetical protein WC365_01195 [Candidatus Babeliales bacterium]|jgi:hypothetical protein
MREVNICLRYKCSQCGEYFDVMCVTNFGEDILEQPPIVVFNMYHRDVVHTCYGKVPDGRQRFFGLGKLVGWSWRYFDGESSKKV